MRRIFRLVLGALAMAVVALVSALVTMRFAIHGGEVQVPNLAGLTMQEARTLSASHGLNMTVENNFYSTVVPPGRVLSQSPAAGALVRREWHVRVTQSLGPQKVSIPSVVGQNERDAALAIRHQGLDLGTVAHLPGRGSVADIVLAQTPPPNAAGIDRPRVSLLLSEVNVPSPAAFMMPDLTGMNYSLATLTVTDAGLHVISVQPLQSAIPSVTSPSSGTAPIAPMASSALPDTVVAQSPPAGHRVVAGDAVRLTIAR